MVSKRQRFEYCSFDGATASISLRTSTTVSTAVSGAAIGASLLMHNSSMNLAYEVIFIV